MISENLTYNIGLTLLNGVGDVLAKNLVAYCGSAEAVFKTTKAQLEKIPGIGSYTLLKPIFEYLNGSVSYDDIKLSLLFLNEFE